MKRFLKIVEFVNSFNFSLIHLKNDSRYTPKLFMDFNITLLKKQVCNSELMPILNSLEKTDS